MNNHPGLPPLRRPERAELALGPRSRRARKRGNGEGTISKRADGRYTAAIFVTRPDGTRGRKWIYGAPEPRWRPSWPGWPNTSRPVQWCLPAPLICRSTSPTGSPRSCQPAVGRRPWRSTGPPSSSTYARTRHHRLDKLTVATVQRYLNGRRARGDSVAKLEMIKVVAQLGAQPRHARGARARNVAQLTTLPVEHRARRTAWTAAQARVFLRAAAEDPAYPVFVLAVVYGLRRGEIAALRWEDLDFTGDRLSVRASLVRVDGSLVRGPVKTAAGVRTLPLVALSRTALIAQRPENEQRTAAGMPSASPSGRRRDTSSLRAAAPGRAEEPLPLLRPHRRRRPACPTSCSTTCAGPRPRCSRPRRPRPRRPDHPRPRQYRRHVGHLQRGLRHRDRLGITRVNTALGGESGGTANGEPADQAPRRPLGSGSSAEES